MPKIEKEKKMVIVDPIFRGSRLFYTWLASDLAHSVTVLTRTNAITDESEELFLGRDITIREVIPVEPDAWYYYLNPDQISALTTALTKEVQTNVPDILFFSGIDEVNQGIEALLLSLATQLGQTPVAGVHYWPGPVSETKGGLPVLRHFAKRRADRRFKHRAQMYERLHAALPGFRVALLDERYFDKFKAEQSSVLRLLPDPAPPKPKLDEDLLRIARSEAGEDSILLVGRQSKRKGLEDVLAQIDLEPSLLEKRKLVICGKLEPETERWRPLIESFKDRAVHVDKYLSEQEIHARYLAATWVMLPYKPEFTGSSGVLISAASAGTPVLTTDHGLVGYRVTKNKIGYTYRSENTAQLGKLLRTLPDRHTPSYQYLVTRTCEFALSNTVDAFRHKLSQILDKNS